MIIFTNIFLISHFFLFFLILYSIFFLFLLIFSFFILFFYLYCDHINSSMSCLGCDINTTDGKGKTALHAAAENLLSECMSTLLDAGASVNVTDSCSCTPLWVAATGAGTAENIRLLLQAGADLEIKDMIWKRTPLQVCGNSGFTYSHLQHIRPKK